MGDYVEFEFGQTAVVSQIRIVPGYAKVDPCDSYYTWCTINYIPSKVRVEFDDGTVKDLNLNPKCGWQTFMFDPVKTQGMRFTILDSYPPSHPNEEREFAPLSEIELNGYLE